MSPHHYFLQTILFTHPRIALNQLHNLGRYILIRIIGHRQAIVPFLFISTAVSTAWKKDFPSMPAGQRCPCQEPQDAPYWYGCIQQGRMPHRSEETALSSGRCRCHSQQHRRSSANAVVVVETERFMLNHTSVKCKTLDSRRFLLLG